MKGLLYDGNSGFVLWVAFGRMDSFVRGVMVNVHDLLIPDDGTLPLYGVLPMALNPSGGYSHCHMVPDDC
jgi:hypothetical protein